MRFPALVFPRCNCCGDFCRLIRKRGVRLCCHSRLSIIIAQISFCRTWGTFVLGFGDKISISFESYTVLIDTVYKNTVPELT